MQFIPISYHLQGFYLSIKKLELIVLDSRHGDKQPLCSEDAETQPYNVI